MKTTQILIVQLLEFEPEETDLNPTEMLQYIKEKLRKMHNNIDRDGQPIEVIFSQTKLCVDET